MKATGIIRRIDDLGRVVIPIDIRTSMKICEGDPLEIFLEDDKVIFQKYGTKNIDTLLDDLKEALKDERRPDLAEMVNMIGKVFHAE